MKFDIVQRAERMKGYIVEIFVKKYRLIENVLGKISNSMVGENERLYKQGRSKVGMC